MIGQTIMQNPLAVWIIVIGLFGLLLLIVVIELFYHERRKAFIGKWIGNVFTVAQVKRLNSLQKSIKIGFGKSEITIPFDIGKPTLVTKRKTRVYCVDFDTKTQIGFDKSDFEMAGDFYDSAFARGGIKHMVSGMMKPQIAGYILYIIIGLAIGVPSGILIGMNLL